VRGPRAAQLSSAAQEEWREDPRGADLAMLSLREAAGEGMLAASGSRFM
jgi:hypothetical protein